MNLAIQSTTARTWKSVRAHHVVAGGLAVVLAALAAAGSLQLLASDVAGRASVQGGAPAVVAPSSATTSQPRPFVYVVSSPDQAQALRSALDHEVVFGGLPPLEADIMIVSGEADLEHEATVAKGVQIIDLRVE